MWVVFHEVVAGASVPGFGKCEFDPGGETFGDGCEAAKGVALLFLQAGVAFVFCDPAGGDGAASCAAVG